MISSREQRREPQHAVTDEAQLEILGTAEQATGEVVGDYIDVGSHAHEFFAPFLNLGEEEIDAFSEQSEQSGTFPGDARRNLPLRNRSMAVAIWWVGRGIRLT